MALGVSRSLLAYLIGFVMEGATELYQLFVVGRIGTVWIGYYYLSLATTVLGFVFFYFGARFWRAVYPLPAKPPRRRRVPWNLLVIGAGVARRVTGWADWITRKIRRGRRIPWRVLSLGAGAAQSLLVTFESIERAHAPPRRPRPWSSLVLFVGGTISTAILNLATHAHALGGTPAPFVWLVGGVVVLAFGAFFFGLARRCYWILAPVTRGAVWAAFGWSLGVAALTGVLVGDLILPFLREFFSNWGALAVSFAPVAVQMAWLFPAYLLLIVAYVDAYFTSTRPSGAPRSVGRPVNARTPTLEL